MEPVRERSATLVDLLDRVLDKGVVLHADVIISVAGIPLIGLSLRAALAGMETMLQYGLMENWDKDIRAWESEQEAIRKQNLLGDHKIILKSLGAHYYKNGIYRAWRYGHFHLTEQSLLLYHQSYDEILLSIPLKQIISLNVRTEATPISESCEVLYLMQEDGTVHRLRCRELHMLKTELYSLASNNKNFRDNAVILPESADSIGTRLIKGEEVSHSGSMWHLCTDNDPGNIVNTTWRPGKLYLSNQRLCWEHQTESKIVLDIPIDSLSGCNKDERYDSLFKWKTPVLDLIYQGDSTKQVASFAGQEVDDWHAAIQVAVKQNGKQPSQEKESCPECGTLTEIKQLLDTGCPHCDWLSARMKRKKIGVPV